MVIKPLRLYVALIGLLMVKSKAWLSLQEKLRVWKVGNGGEVLA
jgi:hypothetical protein